MDLKGVLQLIFAVIWLAIMAATLLLIANRNYEYALYTGGAFWVFYFVAMAATDGNPFPGKYVDRWDVGREDETDIDLH